MILQLINRKIAVKLILAVIRNENLNFGHLPTKIIYTLPVFGLDICYGKSLIFLRQLNTLKKRLVLLLNSLEIQLKSIKENLLKLSKRAAKTKIDLLIFQDTFKDTFEETFKERVNISRVILFYN